MGPVASLRRLLATAGGFTLHAHTLESLRRGIAVGAEPDMGLTFPWCSWDDREVAAWLEGVRPTLWRNGSHVGGWLDRSGYVWLDAVDVYPAALRPVALAVASRRRQHAVFDLASKELRSVEWSRSS